MDKLRRRFKLAVPPAIALASYLVWRSRWHVPISKVTSTAEIGRLRSVSEQNLKALNAQEKTRMTSDRKFAKRELSRQRDMNKVSVMSTKSLLQLLWQTLNSKHLRGGFRRIVVAAFCLSLAVQWIQRRFFGEQAVWSLRQLVASSLLIQWWLYYRRNIVEMPVVRFNRDYYHVSLVLRSRLARTPFRPVPWLVRIYLAHHLPIYLSWHTVFFHSSFSFSGCTGR